MMTADLHDADADHSIVLNSGRGKAALHVQSVGASAQNDGASISSAPPFVMTLRLGDTRDDPRRHDLAEVNSPCLRIARGIIMSSGSGRSLMR